MGPLLTVPVLTVPVQAAAMAGYMLIAAMKKSYDQGHLENRKELDIDAAVDKYNICVCGMSGVGKTTFINGLRGLKNNANGAAPSGTKQTTNISSYPILNEAKEESNLVLWRIPTDGTTSTSTDSFKKMQLFSCDVLVILTAFRFTEIDLAIAQQAKRLDTRVVFVRNMADRDVQDKCEDTGMSIEDAMKEIRNEAASDLVSAGFHNVKVFLISAKSFTDPTMDKYDALELLEEVVDRYVVTTQRNMISRVNLESAQSLSLRQFIRDVADFYLGSYRALESFDANGDSQQMESVRVDLQSEGSREPFDDYKGIFVQMGAKNCRLAIVRGQPGSGKTTLARKIAYDWAKEEKKEIFDLILAVPLRDVQLQSDLLEMAVGIYASNHNEAKHICTYLRRQRLKILLILDDLDEIQISTNLEDIFASVWNNVAPSKPDQFDCDMLITSRPSPCHLNQSSTAAMKYDIVGYTEAKQVDFVSKRCRTRQGMLTVVEYLNKPDCANEVIQNPFLFNLICLISDHSHYLPSTLTNLHVTFVYRTLIRAAHENQVGNKFDLTNWQQSKLLEDLGSLALFGAIKNQFQFSRKEMQICHVGDDHVRSGLLRYRSDTFGSVLKCDFPHRSIQDFLAAFYAVHYWRDKTLIAATEWPAAVWPPSPADFFFFSQMKVEIFLAEMIRTNPLFCRFFFGLLHDASGFPPATMAILEETFGDYPKLISL